MTENGSSASKWRERRAGRSDVELRRRREELLRQWESEQLANDRRIAFSCPACAMGIERKGWAAFSDIQYRCPVCRLDFVIDPGTGQLMPSAAARERGTPHAESR